MTKIHYFTRTGDSEKIAQSIASQTGGELYAITDGKNWHGAIGYIKGGFYATIKKKTIANYSKPCKGDKIYLCFPIWAGTFPPAVRCFVEEVERKNIIAVPTSMSSSLSEKDGFLNVIEIIGKDKSIKID